MPPPAGPPRQALLQLPPAAHVHLQHQQQEQLGWESRVQPQQTWWQQQQQPRLGLGLQPLPRVRQLLGCSTSPTVILLLLLLLPAVAVLVVRPQSPQAGVAGSAVHQRHLPLPHLPAALTRPLRLLLCSTQPPTTQQHSQQQGQGGRARQAQGLCLKGQA